MSRPHNTVKLKIALIMAAMLIDGLLTVSTEQPDLPQRIGVEVARDSCLSCHEPCLIVSQRLSRQGWTREVDKMIRWGATVAEAEKAALIDYLAGHFGPKKVETTNL